MKQVMSKVALLLFLLLPTIALADIAVLVHGYHSSGASWRGKGIVHLFTTRGWNDAGFYAPYSGNVAYPGRALKTTGNHLVTAELPSEAAIDIQANLLGSYLIDIHNRFPDQPVHLIAHSAGGIVARLTLVNNPNLPVIQLITIATPHLGSPIAEFADLAADSPISAIGELVGSNELNRAEQLYKQLRREKENQFLFWLNRQPHPHIPYVSIVRSSGSLISGDRLVPPYSQNMAYVPAIGDKSSLILTSGKHGLKYSDGLVLLPLLP